MSLGFIRQYLGLPGRIYVLFLARIIAAMGSFIYSFLTLFMSNRLGYSEGKIAYYLLLLALVSLPAALIGGKLADMFSRKMTYVLLMATAEIMFFVSGFMIDNPHVLIFIFGGFFFVNAGSPIISAMMMDYTTPANRQESMSLVYLGFNLGYAFGPMIAGFLFVNYIRWVFWGNALINGISVLLILTLIKENPREKGQPRTQAKQPKEQETELSEAEAAPAAVRGGLLRQLMHDPVLVAVALFMASATFSYAQVGYMMPLDMESYFGIEVGSRAYGVIWSLNGLGVFLLTPICVYLFKKNPPMWNIAFSMVLFAIGFMGYAFTHNLFIMYFLVLVWTAGEVIDASNTGVFIANHAPKEFRARYQSIYDIIQGTGRAVGPMIMGSFLMNHTASQGWLLCGGLCVISAVAYFLMYAAGKR